MVGVVRKTPGDTRKTGVKRLEIVAVYDNYVNFVTLAGGVLEPGVALVLVSLS
jgi:hypothetical protein